MWLRLVIGTHRRSRFSEFPAAQQKYNPGGCGQKCWKFRPAGVFFILTIRVCNHGHDRSPAPARAQREGRESKGGATPQARPGGQPHPDQPPQPSPTPRPGPVKKGHRPEPHPRRGNHRTQRHPPPFTVSLQGQYPGLSKATVTLQKRRNRSNLAKPPADFGSFLSCTVELELSSCSVR